ncbi:MAG: Sua5/YciO/YrdC/YwlC family protein, partial [Bacteroidota bacterium]
QTQNMDAITLQKNISLFEKDYVEDIVKLLENDGMILLPTDTVWCIGGDATNAVTIERIKKLKQANSAAELIVLVDSIEMLKTYVTALHPRLETLMLFHTRPMTVIYQEVQQFPFNAMTTNSGVAIRIVQDKFCQRLIKALGRPLITSSANTIDQSFPTIFGEISSKIIRGVDYVVRHRRTDKTPQQLSVIIKYDGKGELTFIRE